MNKPPITLAEIKELEQIVFDLRAMQSILFDHTKRVEEIVKKYSMTKSDAALKREEKARQRNLQLERFAVELRGEREKSIKRGRIKYLKANPEPGSEREIERLQAEIKSIGKFRSPL